MNDLQVFLNYYRIGSSFAGRMVFHQSAQPLSGYSYGEEDPFAGWVTRLIARYVEAPLTRVWDALWERVGL